MRPDELPTREGTAVLLADDHAIVREGLRLILEQALPDCVVGKAENADEILALIHERRWDVLVLDLAMPGRSGVDVLQDVKKLAPNLPVLVLSMYPESQFATRVLAAGADGYLSKGSDRDEFIKAIRTVLAGRKYISSLVADLLASRLAQRSGAPPHELLSNREYDVMRSIAVGRTVTEIARDLSVSAMTVSTYRKRVLEKLRLRTNSDLTRHALEQKLL